MFNFLGFLKECFLADKTNNGSCEFDYVDSMRRVLNKRYNRENRAHENLSKRYDNLDELSEEAYSRLWYKEADKIHEEDQAEDIRRKSLLRIIKTLRTEEEIENAMKKGQKVLKQKLKPSEDIKITDVYIKDKKTGETTIKPYSYHAICLGTSEDREIVKKVTYYPYNFPSKVAAYLLPDNLQIGEKVILEDLIEDIVGASHAWGTYRLDSAEAVWNGEKFEVDCDSYDVEITMG